jgi:hypothetical protein
MGSATVNRALISCGQLPNNSMQLNLGSSQRKGDETIRNWRGSMLQQVQITSWDLFYDHNISHRQRGAVYVKLHTCNNGLGGLSFETSF